MTTPRRKMITLDLLIEKGACKSQRDLFAKHFPEGLAYGDEHIPELVERIGLLFDWEWAAYKMLPKPCLVAFEKGRIAAWKAYSESVNPSRVIYSKVCDIAWAAHVSDKGTFVSLQAYDEATIPARDTHFKEMAPFREVYDKVCALSFLTLFLDSP